MYVCTHTYVRYSDIPFGILNKVINILFKKKNIKYFLIEYSAYETHFRHVFYGKSSCILQFQVLHMFKN